MQLKLNDTIKVITGNDKGRTGKITKINHKKGTVYVDGLNTYKRHLKAQGNQAAGIVTLSRPLQGSNVMLVCPHCSKTTRIATSGLGREQIRLCRHCQKPLDSHTPSTKSKKKA